MPKYQVTLYFEAAAAYDVESDDEDEAIEEAHRLHISGTEADFNGRLSFYYTNAEVYEDDEE